MKIIYPDTETTGLYPEKGNELVQLSGVIEVDGKIVDEFNIFARPVNLKMVEAKALAVQHKTLEQVLKYPARKIAYAAWKKVLDKHVDKYNPDDKFIWVGQNPYFDDGFIKAFMEEHGDKYMGSYFERRKHDLITVALFLKQAGYFSPVNFKLETMAATLGIKYDAHDALADAKCLREIWHVFLGWIKKAPTRSTQLGLKI